MPALNFYDETFVIRITVDETPTEMWALMDTGLGHTVLQTANCADCGTSKVTTSPAPAGLTVSATAASGRLNNPPTTYSGFEGTTTFCIFEAGDYATAPTTANFGAMPCI